MSATAPSEGAPAEAVEALQDLSAAAFRCFVALKLRQAQRNRQAKSTTAAGKAAAGQNWRRDDDTVSTLQH
jgi:hypothetical protein